MMRYHFIFLTLCIIAPVSGSTEEQSALDKVSQDFYLRARTEYVDWFQAPGAHVNDNYSFSQTKAQFGLKFPGEQITVYAQGQYSQLYNLPVNGVGLGANYYGLSETDTYAGDIILRQVHLQAKADLRDAQFRGLFGRFLYSSGSEVVTDNKELEALKSRRIFNRVIGTFDFVLGRSFDGAQLSLDRSSIGSISGGWMRPTQGGLDSDGSAQIEEINLATAALTSRPAFWPGVGELQLFTYYYDDTRESAVKLDNRSLEERGADGAPIEIVSFGGHWLQFYNPEDGVSLNTLLWGIGQSGDWGDQSHRAWSIAAESGITFTTQSLRPEFRIGWNYGTGDSDPTDDEHHTFFVMLPTARQYALTPFFNSMNTHDFFIENRLQLSEALTFQAGAHYLRLASGEDLLYAGGGANRSHDDFGFKGGPLTDADVGTLVDLSLSWKITKEISTQIYFGHLFGGDGVRGTYDSGDLTYAFLELVTRL